MGLLYGHVKQNHIPSENQFSSPEVRQAKSHPKIKSYTVDLVIFAFFNFLEFSFLGLFTKLGIREFPFYFRSTIIIIIFTRFVNS